MTRFASLCFLSYNRPQFIVDAITSAIVRADFPMEVIVHDDGSIDPQTRDLLRQMIDQGTISTLIENPPGHNQGVGHAINRCFGMARGDYLLKLDQDLIFYEGWLRHLVLTLDSNWSRSGPDPPQEPAIGLMGLFRYPHDPVDCRKTIKQEWVADSEVTRWEEHTHICGSDFAQTRHAWERFGPFAEHSDAFAEDWERMKEIDAAEGWACGLPSKELCHNVGFGIGPSTVVEGEDKVASIEKEPYILNPRRAT